MIKYLEDFVKLIVEDKTHNRLPQLEQVKQVYRELDQFDLRDFEPKAQVDLLQIRGVLQYYATIPSYGLSATVVKETMAQLLPLLKYYRGKGTGITPRTFAFIIDPDLRGIIERDYAELTLKLFPSGAWKSTVILAGSILEAILLDRLADVKWKASALASKQQPKDNSGAILPMDKWRLQQLIDISLDINLLQQDPANTVHQVLRDYRNFVHPKKEIRAAHPCTEAEAMLSLGALNSVCNYIESNP